MIRIGFFIILGAGLASAQDFEYGASGRITGKARYCGSGRPHAGGPSLDINNGCGTCIYAARGGTAYYYGGCRNFCSNGDGCNGAAGNYVQIYHTAGYKTRYLHGLAGTQVTGTVSESRKILKMGSTGGSGASHLHQDIWRNGTRLTAWLNSVPPCYSTVTRGYNIPYNFPSISAPANNSPWGCN